MAGNGSCEMEREKRNVVREGRRTAQRRVRALAPVDGSVAARPAAARVSVARRRQRSGKAMAAGRRIYTGLWLEARGALSRRNLVAVGGLCFVFVCYRIINYEINNVNVIVLFVFVCLCLWQTCFFTSSFSFACDT